jgi:hypothetical protein
VPTYPLQNRRNTGQRVQLSTKSCHLYATERTQIISPHATSVKQKTHGDDVLEDTVVEGGMTIDVLHADRRPTEGALRTTRAHQVRHRQLSPVR